MAAIVARRRKDRSMAYQVRWRQDGTWQSETFGGKRAAQRFAFEVEEAGHRWPPGWTPGVGLVATASAAEPAAAPASFLELADRYLDTRTGVSSYVLMRYRGMVRRLGAHFTTVESIDDQAVARWVRAMQDAGAAPKTIANYHGLLYSVLGYGVRKGVLAANPCADTQLPARSACDADGEPITCFLEPAEFDLIAEAMCASPAYEWRPNKRRAARPRAQIDTCGIAYREDRDLITLAVHTGLRWGELAGGVSPAGRPHTPHCCHLAP